MGAAQDKSCNETALLHRAVQHLAEWSNAVIHQSANCQHLCSGSVLTFEITSIVT
jgi:hypothetical protein